MIHVAVVISDMATIDAAIAGAKLPGAAGIATVLAKSNASGFADTAFKDETDWRAEIWADA